MENTIPPVSANESFATQVPASIPGTTLATHPEQPKKSKPWIIAILIVLMIG